VISVKYNGQTMVSAVGRQVGKISVSRATVTWRAGCSQCDTGN